MSPRSRSISITFAVVSLLCLHAHFQWWRLDERYEEVNARTRNYQVQPTFSRATVYSWIALASFLAGLTSARVTRSNITAVLRATILTFGISGLFIVFVLALHIVYLYDDQWILTHHGVEIGIWLRWTRWYDNYAALFWILFTCVAVRTLIQDAVSRGARVSTRRSLPCECGTHVPITEISAGSSICCPSCGGTMPVPSLTRTGELARRTDAVLARWVLVGNSVVAVLVLWILIPTGRFHGPSPMTTPVFLWFFFGFPFSTSWCFFATPDHAGYSAWTGLLFLYWMFWLLAWPAVCWPM